MYPSIRVRTANPVSVRVRDMVSASLSSAEVESPVLIESKYLVRLTRARLNMPQYTEYMAYTSKERKGIGRE